MSKRLDLLMELMQERGIGNTSLLLSGVSFSQPAVMIFADKYSLEAAFDMAVTRAEIGTPYVRSQNRTTRKINEVQFVTIEQLDNVAWWRGRRCPVGIDHFALTELIKKDRLEWQQKVERAAAHV